jgi:hypothetical protein
MNAPRRRDDTVRSSVAAAVSPLIGQGMGQTRLEVAKKGARAWCSFCAKQVHEVKTLIYGPDRAPGGWRYAICNECVELCVDIVREKDDPPEPPQAA